MRRVVLCIMLVFVLWSISVQPAVGQSMRLHVELNEFDGAAPLMLRRTRDLSEARVQRLEMGFIVGGSLSTQC